jgi:hypothetical protein
VRNFVANGAIMLPGVESGVKRKVSLPFLSFFFFLLLLLHRLLLGEWCWGTIHMLGALPLSHISKKAGMLARCQWLIPVILALQKAKIRRIVVRSHPRQIVHETLFQKHPTHKRTSGVV